MTQPALKSDRASDEKPSWFSQAWLEPRFVVVTLIAILGSLWAESQRAPDALILFLNVTAYVTGGIFGLRGALKSLAARKIDVDMLMILAALGAAMIDQWREGALLLFLFSLSNVLQNYAIGRSRQAIKSLFKLYPTEAKVKRGEEVVTVPIAAIRAGDLIVIQPGDRIPVDGTIRYGHSAIDQAAITGESIPVEKTVGEKVFAGTLNKQGSLDIEAMSAAADTVLARIITMVEQAQDSKAPTERFLDRFEQVYAACILGAVALFIVIPPLLFNADFQDNFYRAMVLMTVASPCALVISTPASFISAIAAAARGGVLFKGGAYLEGLAGIKAVAFDKTGTLTRGQPVVTDLVTASGATELDLLGAAAAIERRSEHPLAAAVVAASDARGVTLHDVNDFDSTPGRGVSGTIDGVRITVGSISYLTAITPLPAALESAHERLIADGRTTIGVMSDDAWMGMIALADEVRPEAVGVVARLRAMGVEVAMLTGDNARVAASIAEQVGITRVYADLMPEDKVHAIERLQQEVGATAMVGDGVNDAPALATAAIGVAMGAAGSDVALETADLVLMGDRLELIPFAIALSKKARRVVWQNIVFSLAVIVVLIAGAFVIDLPLPIGVLGHEGSTVIVVLNGVISLLVVTEIQRRRLARALTP
ncbi:MAG: heavy metal translocating P-type ATPase [Chloroflexota bacterium]|nr:heavy metal translocating P-type ATPase [Chloroflexota bacterium]